MKRLLILLLAIVFCCTLLVGCGKKNEDDNSDNNVTDNSGTENGGTENGGTENGGTEYFSKGLEYALSGKYYVVSGIGTCTDNDVVIPSTYNDLPVLGIGDRAFEECSSLTSITIPNSVTSIGDSAFGGCSSLTSITIPDSVTRIGNSAFEDCSNLTSITIPDSVTSIGGYAFYGCEKLVYNEYDNAYYLGNDSNPYVILVKAKNTDITSCKIHENTKIIYSYAFDNCTSLVYNKYDNAYYLGNDSNPYVVLVKAKNTYITSCKIHENTKIIYSYAFDNCTSLTSITVDEDNKNYKSIDGNLYTKDGKTLVLYAIGKADSSFTIPDSVTSIGDSAFYRCSSLTSVTIGNSVTRIGDYAFRGCTSLTSVTIGNSVTSIGKYAFSRCSSLTSITYDGTVEEWNAISKDSDWIYNTGNYTIYCTDGEMAKDGTVTHY